jgi:hypothetical protein
MLLWSVHACASRSNNCPLLVFHTIRTPGIINGTIINVVELLMVLSYMSICRWLLNRKKLSPIVNSRVYSLITTFIIRPTF